MKTKRFLGVIVMIGVQCVFGIVSTSLPSASLSVQMAIPLLGCLIAAACGGFVARRAFTLPAALVLLADWLLILYVLTYAAEAPKTYTSILVATWPLIGATFGAVVLGARTGMWLHASRRVSDVSSAT